MFTLVPYRLPNGRVSLAFVSLELGELGKIIFIVDYCYVHNYLQVLRVFIFRVLYEFSLNKHINNGLIVLIA